jgi:aldose 1-epimerase
VTSDELTIGNDVFTVVIAPSEGGRLAQMTAVGVDLLIDRERLPDTSDPLAWGSYPMVPWAGRIRRGRFEFRHRSYQLQINLGDHAIHGVGLVSRWDVARHHPGVVELTLDLPRDDRWPFGGIAHQSFSVSGDAVRLEMSATATDDAFPVSLGWHPWHRKPDRLDFRPVAMYRRDDDGMAVDELVDVPPGPWDDCFVNHEPIGLEIDGCTVELTSNCTDWVVYDMPAHATCVEPQTGPPDAFNIRPTVLEPGETLTAWYEIRLIGSTASR